MAVFRMRDASPERANYGIFSHVFKLSLYGCASVGKTAARVKFTQGQFDPQYISTIGIEFVTKTVEINGGDLVRLQIWDTSGQERFRMVTQSYFRRGAHGIILFFDLTNRETFETLSHWIDDLRQDARDDLAIILAGTKCDLEDQRVVSTKEIDAFAKKHDVDFIELSAKTGYNVHALFTMIVKRMVHANISDKHFTPVSALCVTNDNQSTLTQSDSNNTCVFL